VAERLHRDQAAHRGPRRLLSFPVDVTTITVTGTFLNGAGSPQAGAVLFTPTATLTDTTGKIVMTQNAITASVSSTTGEMSVTLACTDNANLIPKGWNYLVNVAVSGAVQQFYANIPSTYGASVDLSQLVPNSAAPAAGDVFVSSVNGQSGTVTVTALNGVTVTNTPSGAGKVLTSVTATTAHWA
jgi:hypothetical protein